MFEVFRKFAGSIGQGFLHHVGGIDPCRHPWIQAESDHLSQPASMAHQQLLPRDSISLPSLANQGVGIPLLGRGHGPTLHKQSSQEANSVTEKIQEKRNLSEVIIAKAFAQSKKLQC